MLKCDLDINAPEISGQALTIKREEVMENAEAYAGLMVWQMLKERDYPKELMEQMVPVMVEYARKGGATVEVPGVVRVTFEQSDDWACCLKHLADWQTFKAMFQKELR